MNAKSLPPESSGTLGKFGSVFAEDVPDAGPAKSASYQPARNRDRNFALQNSSLITSTESAEIDIKFETEEFRCSITMDRVIELARNRAALIAKIRELLIEGETQKAISLVKILCGLEN